jgi:hypothetical protein
MADDPTIVRWAWRFNAYICRDPPVGIWQNPAGGPVTWTLKTVGDRLVGTWL